MNDLKNFHETTQCRTMAEAARRLGITPPSLSQSIKRLEADLGSKLFYRTRTGISLTPAGRETALKAKALLASAAELDGSATSGAVVIGAHPLVASYVVPQALVRLKADGRVELRHDLSRRIQVEVQNGTVDLGLVINPSPAPDLVIRSLGEDEVAVWKAVRVKPLERVLCDPDLFQTQAILRKWKTSPVERITSSSLELIARMTAQGLGYGILPERVLGLLGLKLERVSDSPAFSDRLCLVYRPEFGKTAFERACLEAFRTP